MTEYQKTQKVTIEILILTKGCPSVIKFKGIPTIYEVQENQKLKETLRAWFIYNKFIGKFKPNIPTNLTQIKED